MEDFKRYAIYWAPEAGPLARFAASWLGWDPVTGAEVAHPEVAGLPVPVDVLTATPRKYGFHGTLKAPFRLVEGATGARLHAALGEFAARTAPVTLDALGLARLGRFLALLPEGETAPLARLAAVIVEEFEPFRAPLSPDDMLRRQADALPPRQRDLLARYGYPYVMEEFRFHLTLTGSLDPATAEAVRRALAPVLAPLLPRPFRVDAICLFGEAADGRFHAVHRYALTG